MKSLLVAAGLCVGMSTWADGTKRILNAQNYENADATDWIGNNNCAAVLMTGDEAYGKYAQCSNGQSGNRGAYKSVTFNYSPDAYLDATMTQKGYNIEFDFALVSGNVENRSQSQFLVPTSGPNLISTNSYSGSDYIFSLSQPTIDLGTDEEYQQGKASGKSQLWYINDLSNSTGVTVTLDENWYHLSLVVSSSSVSYTISRESSTVATGTKTVSSLPTITGFCSLVGRGTGKLYFDNLDIYDYTATVSVTPPTFTFKNVSGANRIYTLSNPDNAGTLYYTTTPAAEAPAVGSSAYTSTTSTSVDVTYATSGKYYAYVLHTNGTTSSSIASQTVTAGALTLAAPVITITDMVKAEDGYYYPKVSFSSDNSALEGAPTASFDISNPYTFTEVGSITVTASADGYTSSSSTFTVSNKYVLSNTIDFGALKATDFDGTVWESATGAPRDLWTNRAAAIPADATYYKLKSTSAIAGDPDNSSVLEGITISNYYQRVPQVYIGFGLLTPYDAVNSGSNNMNFTVNGCTADDYVVYNGWNNYGNGTFNTVQKGNVTFGLYRYDTMLRTIKVYSPSTVSATLGANGYSTFTSTYDLDLSGLTDFKAYTATLSGTTLSFVENTSKVKAGTGLLLKGTADAQITIPVATTGASAVSGNALTGVTAATTLKSDAAGNYIFVMKKATAASDALTFLPLTTESNVTVPAGKAYVSVAASAFTTLSRALTISFANEATGISSVKVSQSTEEVYDLQGRRVAQPTKGLYIVNGKKVIIK